MNTLSQWFVSNYSFFEDFFKLLIACLLGGLVGYQRESSHRPAGLRTHILVCVGSALVMITSEYIFDVYRGVTNLDPARLGAQVISGIGFLGAGTILRDGSTIKGLTTAAGLWAVSCIGIAIGAGFYSGGIAAAFLVYLTLTISKDWEVITDTKNRSKKIKICVPNSPGIIGRVESILIDKNISIKTMKVIPSSNNESLEFLIYLDNTDLDTKEVISSLVKETEDLIENE
ncbi:MAG: MgtC/SapB family protein [Deltaproteobacteria bacterium]